jgi:hypothetical protein
MQMQRQIFKLVAAFALIWCVSISQVVDEQQPFYSTNQLKKCIIKNQELNQHRRRRRIISTAHSFFSLGVCVRAAIRRVLRIFVLLTIYMHIIGHTQRCCLICK